LVIYTNFFLLKFKLIVYLTFLAYRNILASTNVPAPLSTKELNNNKISEGGNSQKETLFSLGNAISGAPMCRGNK